MAKLYPRGTHLGTRGTFYDHHGIYWGWGQVIHHSGLSSGLNKGPIEKTTLARFAEDWEVFVVEHDRANWREVVSRADGALRSATNPEWAYNVALQNCEHFANWCVTGEKSSPQVARVVTLGFLGNAISKWFEGA